MNKENSYLKHMLNRLRSLRENANFSTTDLEKRLTLGPGWITRFEEGKTIPSFDMLLAILHEIRSTLNDLLDHLPDVQSTMEVERLIIARQDGNNVVVHFRYARFDAKYILDNTRATHFEDVMRTLRGGLARLENNNDDTRSEAIKSHAVAKAFLKAVSLWPMANPSDIWWFIIYRAYCDPFNHPAKFARLDFSQSWKRTGGWALEQVLVQHYGPFLKENGVKLFIADDETKQNIINKIVVDERLESDKIDVVLEGGTKEQFFGVVNVKASLAERRTDDVPMSKTLIKAKYTSVFWTMDCKSTPAEIPINRGELGHISRKRSAKRKDIEDEGYFTGFFSYNLNTQPSDKHLEPERRVYVCNFSDPNDAFSQFILKRWAEFPLT